MRTKEEQKAYEEAVAREEERKKGFMKDLGWQLLIYNLFFGGIGMIMIFFPDLLYTSGQSSPYSSILPFSAALLIDIVSIWHYVKYSPGKPPRHIAPPDKIPGL